MAYGRTGVKLFDLGTGAVNDGSQTPISARDGQELWTDSTNWGAGTALLWRQVGGAWIEVYDGSGTQIALSPATKLHYVVTAKGIYGFTKGATTAAVSVYVEG